MKQCKACSGSGESWAGYELGSGSGPHTCDDCSGTGMRTRCLGRLEHYGCWWRCVRCRRMGSIFSSRCREPLCPAEGCDRVAEYAGTEEPTCKIHTVERALDDDE